MSLNFISIPTEQTSAITDVILAGQSMVYLYLVRPSSANQSFALSLWAWVLGLMAFSSLLGEFVHGFDLAPETVRVLWGPLYFALGLLVALVALAAFAHLGHGNTLVAAAVDTQSTLRLQCIWAFDNHGIFHLIQMLGLLIISLGLYRSRKPIAGVEKSDAKR